MHRNCLDDWRGLLDRTVTTKLHIIITVDTEADIRGGTVIPISKMVYGESQGEYYGITRMMDICEKYACKATFFVSPFEAHVLGEEGMREVCQRIHGRGHDVQLHTHPKWITHERFMWNHSYDKQVELLGYGRKLLSDWIGESPIAHRAGGFGANRDTFRALKSVGIPIDSTNIGSPYCRLQSLGLKRNAVQTTAEGVIELPVTQFGQFKLGSFVPKKPFDINANTLSELKFVIRAARDADLKVVTLLMHSFSFLSRSKDRTVFTPNRGDLNKFEGLLRFISQQPDLEVITVKEFYRRYQEDPQAFITESECLVPVSGIVRSFGRACRYINRGKGNMLLVAGGVSVGVVCLSMVGLLLWKLL
jgi:peptidoglycan/xylan/chitin deacetylase (PgdA/CDA1 family)